VFGLFRFGDEAESGSGDVGFGADGGGEGDLEVWFINYRGITCDQNPLTVNFSTLIQHLQRLLSNCSTEASALWIGEEAIFHGGACAIADDVDR